MMGYGDYNAMMGGFGYLGVIFWLALLIDLILLGIFLWKKIQEKS